MSHSSVLVATFLAGPGRGHRDGDHRGGVGSVRGWHSTWLGAGAGLTVLAQVVLAFGRALQAVTINWLRLVIGSLLSAMTGPWRSRWW